MLLILWSVFIIQNASSQSPSADKERMIYISSSEGDDSNPGTLLKPLKSLSALRDEVVRDLQPCDSFPDDAVSSGFVLFHTASLETCGSALQRTERKAQHDSCLR